LLIRIFPIFSLLIEPNFFSFNEDSFKWQRMVKSFLLSSHPTCVFLFENYKGTAISHVQILLFSCHVMYL
jgi:hypothetical protein